ncbi:MAG: tetratricopeptide repeat protein [Hyphomicrobiaceae bacterium]
MKEAEKAAAQPRHSRLRTGDRTIAGMSFPLFAFVFALAASTVIFGAAMMLFLNRSDIVKSGNPHTDGRIPLPANMVATAASGESDKDPAGKTSGAHGTPDIGAMVARLEARVKDPDATVDDIVMLARSYRALNREAESVELYRRARTIEPQNEQLQLVVASALIRAEDEKTHDEGEKVVDAILSTEPEKPEALWLKSLALIQRHEIESARDTLTKLSGLVEENSDAKNAVDELLATLPSTPDDNAPISKPSSGSTPAARASESKETKK